MIKKKFAYAAQFHINIRSIFKETLSHNMNSHLLYRSFIHLNVISTKRLNLNVINIQ
jgi:hypothetical protein